MTDPAIRLRNVSIVFGSNPYSAIALMETGQSRAHIKSATGQVMGVHNCSLDVAQGEIVVLMGLSGSGKSTLLRAVNGLNPIVQGDVQVHDGAGLVSVAKASGPEMQRLRRQVISMVFQSFGLLPWRNVRENVGLGLELSGLSRTARDERIALQLNLVGLSDWADQPISALSGGMQQRVGLARAFATEAPILLMDEPFSALDPLIRTKLQDELLNLQSRLKRTILFVSHDLDEAFRIGNRIALLDGGRIVQCGTPAEIWTAPATPYVADFVANMNPLTFLRARDALAETEGLPNCPAIPADTPLRLILPRLSEGGQPLAVQDGTRVLGCVTAASVLRALAPCPSARAPDCKNAAI